MEIWKDIESLNNLYKASNYGRIKRVERVDNNNHRWPEKILKASKQNTGYYMVNISIDGKAKRHSVHRLVAECFCEKPDGCDIVNHIDNNPSNNKAENLEWTTYKGNMHHAAKQGRMKGHKHTSEASLAAQEKRKVPVIAVDKDGNEFYFESQAEAAKKLNVQRGHISLACRKEYGYKTLGGYSFKYADPERQMIQPKKVGMSKEELAEITRKRMLGNKYSQGVPCSEETKKKLRKKHGKPICQYDLDMNLIREFDSVNETRSVLGYSVEYALTKKKDHICHGYIWRYKNE